MQLFSHRNLHPKPINTQFCLCFLIRRHIIYLFSRIASEPVEKSTTHKNDQISTWDFSLQSEEACGAVPSSVGFPPVATYNKLHPPQGWNNSII